MSTPAQRRDFRHTKIICTLGPASAAADTIAALARAGMNVARLNMSHGDHPSHEDLINKIKVLNGQLNHPIATLVDLQGPEIRTGEVSDVLHLTPGETISLTVSPVEDPEEKSVLVNYEHLVQDVKVGDRVTVDNGLINLEVLARNDRQLKCRVLDGGSIGSRRHVNLPGIRVKLPGITDKDRGDIAFAVEHGVDFIALSFVRSAEDVEEARRLVQKAMSPIKIYAKIENQEGVENFDTILQAADGTMVARGDLGVEVDMRELPVIQRRMVRESLLAGKPVIVATHLLESMINNAMPTRAEVSDVANACYEGADALMLSGETSAGQHPVRCVQVMDDILRRIEKEPSLEFHLLKVRQGTKEELANAACRLADSLGAPGIVVITRRGTLVELVASCRPKRAIIYGFASQEDVRRRLWMLRSVVPMPIELSSDPEETVRRALERLRERNRLLKDDAVVVITDVEAGHEKITSIQVRIFR